MQCVCVVDVFVCKSYVCIVWLSRYMCMWAWVHEYVYIEWVGGTHTMLVQVDEGVCVHVSFLCM